MKRRHKILGGERGGGGGGGGKKTYKIAILGPFAYSHHPPNRQSSA